MGGGAKTTKRKQTIKHETNSPTYVSGVVIWKVLINHEGGGGLPEGPNIITRVFNQIHVFNTNGCGLIQETVEMIKMDEAFRNTGGG